MLDTRTGAWQAIPQSPHQRMSHGVAGSGTQAFLVGGLGENSVDCFDTVAEKWYAVGNLQEEHEAPGVICHGRHLYVFGGAGKQGSMTCVERYDIDRKQWDSMAAMPVARAFSATAVFEDFVFLLGGRSNSGPSQHVQLYDLRRDQWHILPQQLPAARSSGCAVVLYSNPPNPCL
ncbi:hypothetical protein CSKR_114326 [Clonorchis sinensis]|uniref:Uncharacterized protein n=1 Tax=Clonorchis sinensis TaxID=79923 RepID=A0A8T1MEA3_CLOSI|nr:hypothetical protein CSKR_114326 [Clonorchis sinensis]